MHGPMGQAFKYQSETLSFPTFFLPFRYQSDAETEIGGKETEAKLHRHFCLFVYLSVCVSVCPPTDGQADRQTNSD